MGDFDRGRSAQFTAESFTSNGLAPIPRPMGSEGSRAATKRALMVAAVALTVLACVGCDSNEKVGEVKNPEQEFAKSLKLSGGHFTVSLPPASATSRTGS